MRQEIQKKESDIAEMARFIARACEIESNALPLYHPRENRTLSFDRVDSARLVQAMPLSTVLAILEERQQ
eukprot:1384660-Amphidinium_carterae.1